MCNPKREASEEPKPVNTLILDFSFQNYEKMNFCWLSHPVCSILLWQLKLTETGDSMFALASCGEDWTGVGRLRWTFMMVVSNQECRKDDSKSVMSYVASKVRTKIESSGENRQTYQRNKGNGALMDELSGLKQQSGAHRWRDPCRDHTGLRGDGMGGPCRP